MEIVLLEATKPTPPPFSHTINMVIVMSTITVDRFIRALMLIGSLGVYPLTQWLIANHRANAVIRVMRELEL